MPGNIKQSSLVLKYVDKKLRDRGLKMGDDVVLMVVNVGEVCAKRFRNRNTEITFI
jgi:hypothetical protein